MPGSTLTFLDEFNSSGLDPAKWRSKYDTGAETNAGNNELQRYLDSQIATSGGELVITGEDTPSGGFSYISGLINSSRLFAQLFGSFTVEFIIPAGQGLWPAVWTLNRPYFDTSDSNYKWPWPHEGDLVEILAHEPNILYTNWHYPLSSGGKGDFPKSHNVKDHSAVYATATMEWQPNRVIFKIDGQRVHEINHHINTTQAMYLLINLAIGGDWPGSPDGTTPWPAEFKVRYTQVKQYNKFLPKFNRLPNKLVDINPITGITLDTNGAETVARIANQGTGGSAYDLVQVNKVNQGVLLENQANGRPGIQFNGSNTFYDLIGGGLDLFRNRLNVTVYAVWKAANSKSQSLLVATEGGSTNTRATVRKLNNNTCYMASKRLDGVGWREVFGNTSLPNDQFTITTSMFSFEHYNSLLYQNGTYDEALFQWGDYGFSTDTPSQAVRVGVNATGGDPLDGVLIRLIIFNEFHEHNQRRAVWERLAQEYGITTNLVA